MCPQDDPGIRHITAMCATALQTKLSLESRCIEKKVAGFGSLLEQVMDSAVRTTYLLLAGFAACGRCRLSLLLAAVVSAPLLSFSARGC